MNLIYGWFNQTNTKILEHKHEYLATVNQALEYIYLNIPNQRMLFNNSSNDLSFYSPAHNDICILAFSSYLKYKVKLPLQWFYLVSYRLLIRVYWNYLGKINKLQIDLYVAQKYNNTY